MKKNILLFSLVVALQHISAAQNNTIDSLRAILKTAGEDTVKVNAMSLLAYELLNSNTDSAIYYANQVKNLAEKLHYSKGITSAYYRLGQAYNNLGNYGESQSYLSKALELSTDKSTTAKIYVNIGINLWEMGNYPEALKNYFTGLKAFEEAGDRRAIGSTYNNIGIIYNEMGNNDEALKNHLAALKIRQENHDKKGIANSTLNIGIIYFEQGNYTEALKNYFEAKKVYEEVDDKYNLALAFNHIGLIYKYQQKYDEGLKNYFAALKIQEEVGDKEGVSISYNNIGLAYLEKGNVRESKVWIQKGLEMAKEMDVKAPIRDSYQALARADSALGNYNDAYESYKKYILYRDSILNKENTEKIVQQKMQYEFDKKETQSKAEQAVTKKELQRQKLVRNVFVGGFAIVLLSALLLMGQRNKIKKEKKRSDELLLNILPDEVANEIKLNGSSKPKTFSMVTVMFTDFKDFTHVSQNISAELLVAELDYCFSAFDKMLQKYKIEKIKTVGDAYLCASGLPVSSFTHATDMVSAAIEISNFMLQRKKEKELKGEIPFEIRIGIHTGPVVAGIVGVKKYAYDIWGDTVNVAARMEQNSEAGRINISGSTYELVKDKFKCVHRGKIQAKNKGEIDMFFIEKTS
jgi:class 3 adenylate cyclase/Flp pilus assembly protein TadD